MKNEKEVGERKREEQILMLFVSEFLCDGTFFVTFLSLR